MTLREILMKIPAYDSVIIEGINFENDNKMQDIFDGTMVEVTDSISVEHFNSSPVVCISPLPSGNKLQIIVDCSIV